MACDDRAGAGVRVRVSFGEAELHVAAKVNDGLLETSTDECFQSFHFHFCLQEFFFRIRISGDTRTGI